MKTLIMAAAAIIGLAGCAGGHHQHPGTSGPMAPTASTAALKANASVPVLPAGYKKVAAPAGAVLYIINLKNGDTVASPVRVQFGLRGMGVAPAGVEKEGTGHHHLLVNVAEVDVNNPLPANDNFRHFGAGQTETLLELKPGQHTLQLMLADQNHIPHHQPLLGERITITVK